MDTENKYQQTVIKVPRFEESAGFYTTSLRSKIMANIKSKNTKPEVAFRKKLWSLGYRYRINYKKLPGTPDIYLPKFKTIVFIDGEFWHGYNWEEKKQKIKSNRAFWIPKIERNMQRDIQINTTLNAMGYNVIRLWDWQIKENVDDCLNIVLSKIKYVQ